MAGDGGISARFTAYSLALELGWWDVDAMLESMTAWQYREWLAFYKIRKEREETPARQEAPQGKYGTSPDEQRRMSGDILRAMTGYQNRRDRAKGK